MTSGLCWKCGSPAKVIVRSVYSALSETSSQAVSQLLRNNDIPLDSDIPFIRDIIAHDQNSLAELDAQIDALCRLREETAECLRQHRAVLSPVRRIPPELICEIFALAWFSEDDTNRLEPTSLGLVPWHFGFICRSWRRTALAYTPLWSSAITIPRIPSYDSTEPVDDSMTETQLLRSGSAPFCVRVFHGDYASIYLRPSDPVIAQCNRWSVLRVDCFDVGHASFDWLCRTAGRLERLQKLELVTEDSDLMIPEVFSTASALREVILTGPNFIAPSPPISIPWAQITHYRGFYEMARHMEILRAAAPALVECALGVEPGFDHHPDVVTLPRLRRLCVVSSAVVEHLNAPLLETLVSLNNHWQLPIDVLAFIRRSSCMLTRLVMLECDASEELIPLLRDLAALNYLFIEAQFGQSAQTALCNAMTSPAVCPNLTSFLFGYDPTFPGLAACYFTESFTAMVNSRIQPSRSCRLEYLRLVHTAPAGDGSTYIEPPIEPRLKPLRDAGLDAAFMYYHEFLALKGWGDFL
ncbi:hypothetical protein C8R47DRAFT_1270818 [Mycena vitilis]|nr:hypothetical protein C8R47DRAFT_1270818 [Mycena vitilis]